jgi:hypothetical protein
MTTLLKMVSGPSSHEAYAKNTHFSGFWAPKWPSEEAHFTFHPFRRESETNSAGMKKQ